MVSGMNASRLWVRRVVTWGLVAVAAAATALWLSRPQPVPVDLGVVERTTLQVTLDQEGRTRVRRRYVVSAPVSGRLERVAREPGDRVTAGATVVARLRPDEAPLLDARTRATAEARVKSAEAGVAQAEAALDQAERAREFADVQRDRMAELFRQGVVSARDRDVAEADAVARAKAVEVARASLAAAQRELEVARTAVAPAPSGSGGAVVVRAPVDGVVLARLRESESVVLAGEPIVEIGDLSELEIVADYLSADAVQIQAGMPALIERWGGGDPLRARVRLVEPSGFVKISALGVEEQRVNVLLDVEAPRDAWASLGDGYRVEVRVIQFEGEVLAVPASALFRDGDGWAVFAVDDDGIVHRRSVAVGRRTGTRAEVVSGLDAGQRVVLHPSDRVEDGALVEPR